MNRIIWLICVMLFATMPGMTDVAHAAVVSDQPVVERSVAFDNGDVYESKRKSFETSSTKKWTWRVAIQGDKGTFRYVVVQGGKRTWKTIPLQGKLPKVTGFISTTAGSAIVSAPYYYEEQAKETIRDRMALADAVTVQKTADGYVLVYSFAIQAKRVAEMWSLRSDGLLVDWRQPEAAAVWARLDMHGTMKWLSKGFYVQTPSTYRPTGPDLYWLMPDNYIAKWLLKRTSGRAADALAYVMLKVPLERLGSGGYWQTAPMSTWLRDDYGIGYGFYDTRFNLDFAEYLLLGYGKYGDRAFLDAAVQLGDGFVRHVDAEKFVVRVGARVGWLVPDYGYAGAHRKTHMSLNHQLQELKVLYQLYLVTGDARYRVYADQLLLGVELLGMRWVRGDGNLHYKYSAASAFGGQDYPYLTYVDLLEVQQELVRVRGSSSPVLARLAASKKAWMDRAGVVVE